MERLETFEFCVKVMNRWGNLTFGQDIGVQVDGKSERNRNGQEKKTRKLIWHLETSKETGPKCDKKKKKEEDWTARM